MMVGTLMELPGENPEKGKGRIKKERERSS